MVKKSVFVVLLACVCVLPLHANTIAVSNSSTLNNAASITLPAVVPNCASPGCPTVVLSQINPSWATIPGADWISVNDTGQPNKTKNPGFIVEPNNLAITFYDNVSLSSPTNATIVVLADDTTSVAVDGVTVAIASGGPYPTCSKYIIGCTKVAEGVFPVTLPAGSYAIAFETLQKAGVSYGVDFLVVGTPEPSVRSLLTLGLL